MALKPTICKADIQFSDIDNGIYDSLKLTLAQHPSETAERMMVRLVVYLLNYHPQLQFTKWLSPQDEPDLWQMADHGAIERWIEVGQASPERMRKGISRADSVSLYAFGRESDVWWHKHQGDFAALPGISVWQLEPAKCVELEQLAGRNMQLAATISDGELFLHGETEWSIRPQLLLGS